MFSCMLKYWDPEGDLCPHVFASVVICKKLVKSNRAKNKPYTTFGSAFFFQVFAESNACNTWGNIPLRVMVFLDYEDVIIF